MKASLKNFFSLFFESGEPKRVHSKPVNIVLLVVDCLFFLYIIFYFICMLNNIDLSNVRILILTLFLLKSGIDYLTSRKK